jgi:hypothetical protein
MALLTERYSEKINGVLSCYDRTFTSSLFVVAQFVRLIAHLFERGLRAFFLFAAVGQHIRDGDSPVCADVVE